MRNKIVQAFIHGYPELIQSDNGKEFTSKILNTYFAETEVKYFYVSPYHPQSQGAIEASIKQYKDHIQQHIIMKRWENEQEFKYKFI